MHLFFPFQRKGNFFYISGSEYKHLKVRRIRFGEEIGIIYKNRVYKCVLKEKGKEYAIAEIVSVLEPEIPNIELTLYQAVTHNLQTMDFIIQKAVELGIAHFTPLITERSFKNIHAIEKREVRWKKIATEAMKQSGRPNFLKINPPQNLEDLEPNCELNILLDNFSEGLTVKELTFENLQSVSVIVGPEGGFSKKETDLLRRKGFIPVRLKPYVLRTETAAVAAISIIMNFADP